LGIFALISTLPYLKENPWLESLAEKYGVNMSPASPPVLSNNILISTRAPNASKAAAITCIRVARVHNIISVIGEPLNSHAPQRSCMPSQPQTNGRGDTNMSL